MPTRLMAFLHKAMRWVRYAYFLRFSLGLWFFALILCWLNTSSARTLTSGIMTPETIQQYACVGFFLVSAGFVALITARVVLINGPERWDKGYDEFDDGRPPSLKILLVERSHSINLTFDLSERIGGTNMATLQQEAQTLSLIHI